MSSQTMQRQAPSPELARMASGDNNYPIARPSLNAWISAVMTQHGGGAVSSGGNVVGSPSNSAFAAPLPRKPSSGGSPVVVFKLSEVDATQRSVPTPRSFPNAHSAALSAGGSLCASAAGGFGGGSAFAASPPCSQQRSMLGPDDRRPSEESIPGAFTPWQQPRQARSRPSSQRASVNSRAFQRQRSPPATVPEGSLLDVLATVCAVKDPAPVVSTSESADRRSALEAAARAMPMDHVLKSALQIVAAERGIKNAAAVAAAHAQHRRHAAGASRGATEDAADAPPAKRFAAAGPADTGATAITRPVAVARRGSSELSPRLSGQSAAQNNNGALYPAPSSAWPAPSGSLYPLPSVGTAPSHGYGGIGGFEAQRSTMSVRGADRGGAAPSVPEAIADVTALEVAISKTVAASGGSLSDTRTASRLDRMLATLTGARRAMQAAQERAAADAAALAEARLQLQQSAQALAAANQYIVTNISKASSGAEAARCSSAPAPAARRQPVMSPFAKASAAAAMQLGGAARAEPSAARCKTGAACGLQAARSGSGAGVAGSTSPPRDERPGGVGDAPHAPRVAAGGRAVSTAEVLPPWTPDRSPGVDSDGDNRARQASVPSSGKPAPASRGSPADPAAPADRSDALVQQLVSLSHPATAQ